MKERKFETPILFIVFNRIDTTRKVLDAIKSVAPTRLFIAADGPRLDRPGEKEKCEKVLTLIKEGIDWPCEVTYLRREKNLGCKMAVSSAIDWFFENVEEGIILEDDCLPSKTFFSFCSEMLERYRYENRVGHIGGFNCQFGRSRGPASYYFSQYFHVWGWATWRRAWKGFDVCMSDYNDFLSEKILNQLFKRTALREFWKRNFDEVFAGKIDAWGYQWVYRNLKDDRLAIVPNWNMIENIGFGNDATHTAKKVIKMPTIEDPIQGLLTHPRFMVVNEEADDFTYRTHVRLDWFYDLKRPARIIKRSLGACRTGGF